MARDEETYVWDGEQVAATLTGAVVTLLVLAEVVFGLIDVLSPPVTLALLVGWLLWFLKLYAQDRIPPMFPG